MPRKRNRKKKTKPEEDQTNHDRPAAPVPSTSSALRREGNQIYQNLNTDLAPVLFESRARKALLLYEQALSCASEDEDKCSALKNSGACLLKMAGKYDGLAQKLPLWLDALQWQARAAVHWHAKEPAWADALMETQDGIYDKLKVAISDLAAENERSWALKLATTLSAVPPSLANAAPVTDITRHLLHQGIRTMEQKDHASGLSYLFEAQKTANAAMQMLTSTGGQTGWYYYELEMYELEQEVEELQADIEKHLSICESTKARVQADQQLSDCMLGDDQMNMDAVWQVADSYKYAVVITRELDIESEARALSRLAMLYLKVIKDDEKAQHYTKRSVVLALSMYPVPLHMQWYKDVNAALQTFQMEATQRHEAEWHKLRQPILEELKEELEALQKASKEGTHRLIAHLYERHPPTNPNYKQPACDAENIKKAVLTAIRHYHPDKNTKEPDKRYVLHEEAIKLLNEKHTVFKGM